MFKKINSSEFLFIVFVLIAFFLIVFNKLKITDTTIPTGIFSLSCSRPELNQIKCSWSNCQLNLPERTELLIAKVPNYVQTVEVAKSTDSAVVSVPSSGNYVITLSCLNGDKLQLITV